MIKCTMEGIEEQKNKKKADSFTTTDKRQKFLEKKIENQIFLKY